MCQECGCLEGEYDAQSKDRIEVVTKILDANDVQAEKNRAHFSNHGILAINLMSSPGAGKTSLLEKTIELLRDELKIGVIEGDLETNKDAERIRAKGVPAYQITTGQACHLDAFMVHNGLHHLPLDDLDLVFIENVGNLVCPAAYDVGAHLNVVLLSVTEGDDKPLKYPVIFRAVQLMLITKLDLLPFMDFDIGSTKEGAKKINPGMEILEVSVKMNDKIKSWIDYLTLNKANSFLGKQSL